MYPICKAIKMPDFKNVLLHINTRRAEFVAAVILKSLFIVMTEHLNEALASLNLTSHQRRPTNINQTEKSLPMTPNIA